MGLKKSSAHKAQTQWHLKKGAIMKAKTINNTTKVDAYMQRKRTHGRFDVFKKDVNQTLQPHQSDPSDKSSLFLLI